MNNDPNRTLKIVLITIASVFGGLLAIIGLGILMIVMLFRGGVNALHEYNERQDEEARAKTFTTYYEDGEIVSAAYFYHDTDSNEVVWVDIPEDRIEDLVTDLDSLNIDRVSGMKDYFYGWKDGIKLTYESGNSIQFDGEQIRYYRAGSSDFAQQIYMYFEEGDEAFWEIVSEYTVDGRELHNPFWTRPVEDT